MIRLLSSCIFAFFISLALLSCSGGGPTYPPNGQDPDHPANYQLLIDGKTCRWSDSSFPIKIYIDPAPDAAGAYGAIIYNAAVEAVDTWDVTIDGIPDVFTRVEDFDSCDIVVRWEKYKGGGYTNVLDKTDYLLIFKIALSDDLRDPQLVKLFMGHEMGHVLGLGHSKVGWDLMFSPIDAERTAITKRDRDMVNWLYGHDNYIPIKTW